MKDTYTYIVRKTTCLVLLLCRASPLPPKKAHEEGKRQENFKHTRGVLVCVREWGDDGYSLPITSVLCPQGIEHAGRTRITAAN